MIHVENLVKTFGEVKAVDGISFDVARGEIFAFLGPNGAGKTTTIQMLTTLQRPTSGTMKLDGLDPAAQPLQARSRFGIVFQDPSLDVELTAFENMDLHGALYHVPRKVRIDRTQILLTLFELWDRRNSYVKTFSGGMKRRLNLACALVHDPPVLLFDEPTAGVDPQSRNHLLDTIEGFARAGRTILYTTHYMEEAERLCDRIIIIDHGKVIANDSLDAVRRLTPSVNVLELEIEDPGDGAWFEALRELPGVDKVVCDGHTLRVTVQDLLAVTPRVLDWLRNSGYQCSHVASQRADLETVFLTLTGRSVRNA
jgi:ABC-2 type transport system ATP-binding protein